jgi:GTPase involved in cell partitioning and DNA repair
MYQLVYCELPTCMQVDGDGDETAVLEDLHRKGLVALEGEGQEGAGEAPFKSHVRTACRVSTIGIRV